MFLTNFLYYNGIGLIISSSLFITLEYISEPDIDNLYKRLDSYKDNILFWCLDKVISIKLLKDNLYSKVITPKSFNERYLSYSKESYKYVSYNENHLNDKENYYILERVNCDDTIFIKTPKNDFEGVTKNKPYIQLELILGSKTYDINNIMKQFNISGNVFDYDFMMVFINNYLNEDIEDEIENYELKMLDTDFNSVSLDKTKRLILTSYSYKIE